MKRLLLQKITLSLGLVLASCHTSLKIEERNNRLTFRNENENQGDQEKRWTKEVFTKKYEEKIYEKYQGQLSIKKTENRIVIDFDTLSTDIGINDSTYLCIFTNRLITPEMISCNSHEGHGVLIKEIIEFEKEHKKRFEFWVWQPNFMNPQVIFIEITNKEFNCDSKLEEFVKNAQVTFVYKGWIII